MKALFFYGVVMIGLLSTLVVDEISGFVRSRCVRCRLPINNSAGDTPVDELEWFDNETGISRVWFQDRCLPSSFPL